MNKNCLGCKKVISFDHNINPNRKFCQKACYLNFKRIKASEVKEKTINKEGRIMEFFKMLLNK